MSIKEGLSKQRDAMLKVKPTATRIIRISLQEGIIRILVENSETAKWIETGTAAWNGYMTTREIKSETQASLTRCKVRIRDRENKLNEKAFWDHLSESNPGLTFVGAQLFNVLDIGNGYRILFCGLAETTMNWLIEQEGFVYYDVERTRFIWDGLKTKLEQTKRRKFDAI